MIFAYLFIVHLSCDAMDQQLVKAVRMAVNVGAKPGEVESAVQLKATVNTTRKGDWKSLKITLFRTSNSLPNFDLMEHVVYWVRPVKPEDLLTAGSIVGITWSKKGEVRIFFAEIDLP